jgi:cell shape-determining protein MreC
MANYAPNTSVFSYVFFILLSSFLLYLDFTNETFLKPKNTYKTSVLSLNYFFKNYIFEPLVQFPELLHSKKNLIKQNNDLRLQVEKEYISNFVLSKNNDFFLNESKLNALIDKENNLNKVIISKLIKFDTNNYFCCSNHRLFIKPISDKATEPLQSAIINSQGLIGQIIYDLNGIYEVMLLTDIKHSTPVFSENFHCNAKGSGKPGIISCMYSELIWDEQFAIDQKFYTSGLGGVFPKNILIGNVLDIKNISASEKEIVIKLKVNPITENLFGIVVSS